MKQKTIRCAVYTRKSTEEGLDQEFNSLDAQREAAEAYIKSQKHEGWDLIPAHYDDGGFSGGNMERPALKKLLADISDNKIDVIVVYKVDRLSRSLGDFAKMVELFDHHKVSFVSVTQQFNTTTSMGRLTLNVLLSFAQFEREVTGERIRDKFAASKKKGIWMGGPQPLGYDVVERKLIINEVEAKIVKFIYEYYLNKPEGVPLWKLLDVLREKDWKTKSYTTQKGKKIVGAEFDLKHIYNILKNPIYNGRIKHKHEVFEGEHNAIIDDELWQAVQKKFKSRSASNDFVKNSKKRSEQPKLSGKIFDYLGNRLSPTYSYKYYENGGRYKMRYYVNRDIIKKGKTSSEFKRMRAEYIDDAVEEKLSDLLQNLVSDVQLSSNVELSTHILLTLKKYSVEPFEFLSKCVLFPEHIEIAICLSAEIKNLSENSLNQFEEILVKNNCEVTEKSDEFISAKLILKTNYKKLRGKFHLVNENGDIKVDVIAAEYCQSDDITFAYIAKSFYWNKMLNDGVYKNATEIATIENQNFDYVKKSLKQRFLSPKIIEVIASSNINNSKSISRRALTNLKSWNWKSQEEVII
jgi:DNA invertase Pin-like site-specific DNA recombinase